MIASITVVGNGLAAFFAVAFILAITLAFPLEFLHLVVAWLSVFAFFAGSVASAILVIPHIYHRFYDR